MSTILALEPNLIPAIVQQIGLWSIPDRIELIQELTATFDNARIAEHSETIDAGEMESEQLSLPTSNYQTIDEATLQMLRESVADDDYQAPRRYQVSEVIGMIKVHGEQLRIEDENKAIADYLVDKYARTS